MTYKSEVQNKNLGWVLPRPGTHKYAGGMPRFCEDWLLELSADILGRQEIDVINLFCGMNKYGLRIDMNPECKPDILCDAHHFTDYTNAKADVILADPPYSDAETDMLVANYKQHQPGAVGMAKPPHLNYLKWTAECTKALKPNGILIVYHKYLMPNPNPDIYTIAKRVFIGTRTYHLPRVALLFQRKPGK